MAVASLVLGIISIPTLGLMLIGGVVGLILGVVALRRTSRDPASYGGRGLAIGGIITSSVSFLVAGMLAIGVAIAIPNLLKSGQVSREVSALQNVRDIGTAQVLYSATKGKGEFGDLRALAAAGMVNPGLANGEWNGYVFSSTPLNGGEGKPSMFDTTARPISTGSFGTGNRSFYSNETLVLWELNGEDPPQTSPSDRVPKSASRAE